VPRTPPVMDGELFKRLMSMTMMRKPLGIGTLALFSANPKESLAANALPPVRWRAVPRIDTV
ncbi:hypothetical protein NL393_30790, partial [Klebsiella pneumoniae]|nr:hypothetical protein [Klebsiella pneumoniae]